jgi:cobalt-zinc-cadmium efflux system membrane fusion protein
MSHLLLIAVKWLAAGALLGGVAAGAFFLHARMEEKRRQETAGDQVQAPQRFQGKAIKLNANLADSYGLTVEPAKAATWQERVVVYGRVVPNPRATFEVRAPFAGTLQAVEGTPWPAPGQTVGAGQPLARIALRVGPQERLDFLSKLAEAREKRRGAEEVCKRRQEIVDRLVKARSSGIPQRELDEAQIQLVEAQTQLSSARAALDLWQQCLDEIDALPAKAAGAWSKALAAPAGDGRPMELEVVELAAQPGAAVEAGGLVARLVDCSRALVRLDLPAAVLHAGPPPGSVELTTAAPAAAMKATFVGPAPQVDTASQLVGYFYQAEAPHPVSAGNDAGKAGRTCWRPGLFVQAQLPGGESREAVAVPADALLYHQGRSLVYVRTAPDLYERREVQVLGHEGDRCLVAPLGLLLEDNQLNLGVKPDELVVSSQAQVLLSAEFRRDSDD